MTPTPPPAADAGQRETGSAAVLACPFCGEPDYDLIGLKSHLSRGECERFNETPAIIRAILVIPANPVT